MHKHTKRRQKLGLQPETLKQLTTLDNVNGAGLCSTTGETASGASCIKC